MEPQPRKLRLTPQQEAREEVQSTPTQAGHDFASVEEMLRYDASQTPPPETVAARLQDSLAQEPAPRRPWWKRWFAR